MSMQHDGLVIVLGTLVAVGLIVAVGYLFLTRPAQSSVTTTGTGGGGGSGGGDRTVHDILTVLGGAATGAATGLVS